MTGPLVELHRSFSVAVADGNESERETVRYFQRRSGEVQDWDWLSASPLVVILNEAGAGKTAEIEHRIAQLRERGDYAFFLPIERLCRNEIETWFDVPGDLQEFRNWVRSRRSATHFLDSLDEAKLPVDLDKNPLNAAVRRLEATIGSAWRRTRLVISSRPSAWTETLEMAEVHRLSARYREYGIVSGEPGVPLERFVRLDPLDPDQQRKLAEFVEAPPSFVADLISSGASALATTPLDLLDFVEAYRAALEAGRDGSAVFASLAEIVDRAITRRAAEFGTARPRSSLSPARARAGAQRLACACILGQELSIRLPSSSGRGIDPLVALSGQTDDWSRPEVEQLLACGLFTAAWAGAVRFHHRRSLERLAAEGFHHLLSAGMGLETLTQVLTPSAFGEISVPPPFVETVGWLATLNMDFRRHILRVAPQLLLELGDPAVLPIVTREAALRAHTARYASVRRRGEWFEQAALRRFANRLLEETCRELLRSDAPDEPKRHILELAVMGGLAGCVPEALGIVGNGAASPGLRTAGVEAVGALGSVADLLQIRHIIRRFRGPKNDPDGHARHSRNRFRIECVATCSPTVMSAREAISALSRLERREGSYLAWSEHQAMRVFAEGCPAGELPRVLRWLSRLCWVAHDREFASWSPPRWSELGWHLLPALETICARCIDERPDYQDATALAVEVDHLFAARQVGLGPLHRYDHDTPDRFAVAVRKAPRLRRVIFLHAAQRASESSLKEPGFLLDRLRGDPDRPEGLERLREDLDWMAAEYGETSAATVRAALVPAIEQRLARLSATERRQRSRDFVATARHYGDAKAARAFQDRFIDRARRWRWRLHNWWRGQRLVRNRSLRRQAVERLHRRVKLVFHEEALRRGERFNLAYTTLLEHGSADTPFKRVRQRYGNRAADALQAGCKAFAVAHRARPLGEPRTHGDILALIGWHQIALDNPDRLRELTDDLAWQALTTALKDIHFPDWAAAVALRQPHSWRRAISPMIQWELASPNFASGPRHSHALSLASRQLEALRQALAADVLPALEQSATPSVDDVDDAAKIVLSDRAHHPALLALARLRCNTALAAAEFQDAAIWLAVWLQLDPAPAWANLRRFRDMLWQGDDGLMQSLLCRFARHAVLQNMPPMVLADMAIDFQRHIRPDEDEDRGGLVTARHEAQDLRTGAPTILSKNTSTQARDALSFLIGQPEFASFGDWLHGLLLKQAEAAAAPSAWEALQVVQFFGAWMKRPTTVAELCGLIERRLVAIAKGLETSEFDIRGLFVDAQETDIRAFFGGALQAGSQGWFGVTQESVTAGEKRTDLRIEGHSNAGEIVVVELKLAGASWTGDQLVEHLEMQLVKQYLISRHVREGLYVVVDLGRRATWPMADGSTLNFEQLIERLKLEATRLTDAYPDVDRVNVLPLRIALPTHPSRPQRKSKCAPPV